MTAPAGELGITVADIDRARRAIAPHVCRTPLRLSPSLSEAAGAEVRLKLETMQDTGAFKLRGATNRLLALTEGERKRGVICVSTGNHGRGVAFAAARRGVRCVVCMSRLVPENKVAAIEALGARVEIAGASQDEAEETAARLIDAEGLVPVSPFDDVHVIAGQGTIGLELLEDAPELGAVIVPVSGGGLIGGIALALKAAKPGVRVIGVSMERGAAMHASLAAARPVQVEEEETLADSLGGGIGLENRYTLRLVRDLVDDLILVTEEQIAEAMAHLFHQDRLVAEGGGAVGAAVLLHGLAGDLGGMVAVVVSGCNVDMGRFAEVVSRFRA